MYHKDWTVGSISQKNDSLFSWLGLYVFAVLIIRSASEAPVTSGLLMRALPPIAMFLLLIACLKPEDWMEVIPGLIALKYSIFYFARAAGAN